MTNNIDKKIDDLLLTFAKRVENMQRGKNYGWEDEKQAILALLDEARADQIMKDFIKYSLCTETDESVLISIRDNLLSQLKKERK